jgi:8-oxo-dGTP pyrophosphatase MutT (NUDIX family)
MNTDYTNFVNSLSARLQNPLPGGQAHAALEPASRKKYPANADLNRAKASSVLGLFYPENTQTKLAFIQRPNYNGVHSGQIAFPGGQREKTDRNAEETALRETYEEIGVPPEKIKIIGQLSPLYIPPSNFLVYPFVGYISETPHFIPDPTEVHEVFGIDIHKLLMKSSLQFREVSGKGYRVEVPCYFCDNRLIWGATSMMLNELLEVIRR